MKYVAIIIVMLLLGIFACSKPTEVEKKNTPPQIEFVFDSLAVPMNSNVRFRVEISDEDDDPLTVSWSASKGFLNQNDQGKPTMRWTAPSSLGLDTITAAVTDGEAIRSDTLVLETGTRWSSSINSGTVAWTADRSPYILSPNEFVVNGRTNATLQINSGVKVYIDTEDMEFMVEGALLIDGTSSGSVEIKPNRRKPKSGFWTGIRGNPNSSLPSLEINHAMISYGINGVRADETTELTIKDCVIRNCSEEGIYHRSTGKLEVRSSKISDNAGSGILVERISGVPDSVLIRNCWIIYNKKSGLEFNLPDVLGNANIVVRENSITFNELHGINLISGAYPKIHHNAIFFNDITRSHGGYDIHVEDIFKGNLPYIDADSNYWGGAFALRDSNSISDLIYDGNDKPAIPVKVDFVPWCNAYPNCILP